MARVEESIEVNVPVSTAYNQWTQFEEFPEFMEGVESVKQIDDTHLRWVAEIGGKRHEWEAEITEQKPDRKIAWRAVDGHYNSGTVTFEPVSRERDPDHRRDGARDRGHGRDRSAAPSAPTAGG